MTGTGLTIRQVHAFLAVAELGSFTRAAERLGMAQPALSQQVRELEKALGIRLFDRTTRRVDLTDAGREFRTSATKICEDIEIAVRRTTDLAERRRGRVVIAAPPLLAGTILPQAIAEFSARFPAIQVGLIDAPTDRILAAVQSGEADCGIGTFRPALDDIERRALARDSLLLFCRAERGRAEAGAVAWRELRDRPLVVLTRDSGIRTLVEAGFDNAGVALKIAYEVSFISTAIGLIEAGLASAVLPSYARAAAANHDVAVRALSQPTVTRDIVLIHRRGRSLSPAVAAFEPIVRRCLRRLALVHWGP